MSILVSNGQQVVEEIEYFSYRGCDWVIQRDSFGSTSYWLLVSWAGPQYTKFGTSLDHIYGGAEMLDGIGGEFVCAEERDRRYEELVADDYQLIREFIDNDGGTQDYIREVVEAQA